MLHGSERESVESGLAASAEAPGPVGGEQTRSDRSAWLAGQAGGLALGGARVCSLRLLAVLAVVLVLVAGCVDSEQNTAQGPAKDAASPASENGEDDTASASDGADSGGDLAASVSNLVDQVSGLRGLPAREDVDAELVDSDRFAELAAQSSEKIDEGVMLDQEVLAALRFLPQDADLEALSRKLAKTAVGGVYMPEREALYVAGEEMPLSPLERAITAHEFAHALQDQHYDLNRIRDLMEDDPDTAEAFRYVMEGDAKVIENQWAKEHLSAEERQERLSEQMALQRQAREAAGDVPEAMKLEMVLPYQVGSRFVTTLRDEQGWEAVNDALAEPPTTTVEVYDPQLYLDGFESREPRGVAAPGEDWQHQTSQSFGAHAVALMQPLRQAQQGEFATASQWRGGKLDAWRHGDDVAVGVSTAFAGDGAKDFCDRVERWYQRKADAEPASEDAFTSPRDAMALDCDGSQVRFAVAPTVDTARGMVTVSR